MTPSGIEPETFRFITQHLKHCATAVPTIFTRPSTKYYPEPDESNPTFPCYLFKAHCRIVSSRKLTYSNCSIQSTGTRWRSCLRHCATNLSVAGAIPSLSLEFFIGHNPSGRSRKLSSTQPLTEMSKR